MSGPSADPRPHLRGETPESLAQLWADVPLDLRVTRRIVHRLVHDDRDDIDSVPGLARVKARQLQQRARRDRLRVVDRRGSTVDPFVKYLFAAPDGALFEAVRIPLHRPRYSVCVSSQAGCALACAFCETGRLGLARSLEAWEIVDQVLAVRREAHDRPVTGVVFQGQGEPLLNYDAVMRAAAILRHPSGGRLAGDRITLSTVGILPGIERFADEGAPYRLMLSLASAFDERRARLVPVARRWELPRLAEAMKALARRQGGPVHVAWTLMGGVNDTAEEARELARLFAGTPLRVSVIDVNDPAGRFRRAGDAERGGFLGALAEHGVSFVRRYSGGPDIHAACGMLASSARGGTALGPPPELLATAHAS